MRRVASQEIFQVRALSLSLSLPLSLSLSRSPSPSSSPSLSLLALSRARARSSWLVAISSPAATRDAPRAPSVYYYTTSSQTRRMKCRVQLDVTSIRYQYMNYTVPRGEESLSTAVESAESATHCSVRRV